MTEKPPIGVITGTGVTERFDLSRPRNISTPFGRTTVYLNPERGYVLIPRHGAGHTTPPHGINYRANIAAFYRMGVREVVATSAVGSMKKGFRIGDIGLVEQFLDFTKGRQSTFFEDQVVHTDMTHPYSRRVNLELGAAAKRIGVKLHRRLVYVCTEGPRFETPAEIRMYKMLGGDVVGMTGVPEVVLAKERGMGYSSVAIATNWAAGMQARVSHAEVAQVMKRSADTVKQLIESTVGGLRGEKN